MISTIIVLIINVKKEYLLKLSLEIYFHAPENCPATPPSKMNGPSLKYTRNNCYLSPGQKVLRHFPSVLAFSLENASNHQFKLIEIVLQRSFAGCRRFVTRPLILTSGHSLPLSRGEGSKLNCCFRNEKVSHTFWDTRLVCRLHLRSKRFGED